MARTEDSRLAKQAEADARQPGLEAAGTDDSQLPEAMPAIIVRDAPPALSSARCVSLSASNPYLAILPRDPRRRRAVLVAVDADVYVCSSPDLAAYVAGGNTSADAFYLPKGVPLAVQSKAALWAACTTTASASRVSVLVEKDDD